MSLGPFDLSGGPFLLLYLSLLAATIIAGFIIPARMRPPGRPQSVNDVDQLAYLAGGASRFSEALVARLLAARNMVMAGTTRFYIPARAVAGASAAESGLLGLSSPASWRDIERRLKEFTDPLERRLETAGLLMSRKEQADIRFWATLPYLMLLMFGATKWVIGDMRDRPIGFLTILFVATAVCAAIRWFRVDRRTRAGREAVGDAARRSERLKRAPVGREIGLAVALFGTSVLVGSGLADFHRLRSPSDGGSTGGDSGGDGGGGGGCGGCS
jgi:uncharacterized protein (TIGR04222 family)